MKGCTSKLLRSQDVSLAARPAHRCGLSRPASAPFGLWTRFDARPATGTRTRTTGSRGDSTSMRIGVLGTGRIGLMHARNLAQTTGVDEVVLMGGRSQARLAASVDHICAATQPDAPPALAGNLAPRERVASVIAGVGLAEEL